MKTHSRPPSSQLLKAAVQAAHACGKVLRRNFGRIRHVGEKKGEGLVTNVDVESEETALRILCKAFPSMSALTEESGAHGPARDLASEGRWVLDPLDGTTNYVHGFPMFCVSIAAEWQNEVVAGVIYHPILDETYTAIRGKGARLNGKLIRVSQTPKLNDALLTTGFTYGKAEWLQAEMRAFEKMSGIARAVRRPGSAALDLAYTARGVFDGFWERRLSAWDVAAGGLLVEEAGGKVTDFQGKPFQIEGREIVATNGRVHSALLKAF